MVEANPPSDLDEPPSKGMKPRNRIFTLLKIVASALLILWITRNANLTEVFEALKAVEAQWVALAVMLQFIGAALISVRWQGLLAVHDVRPTFSYLYMSVLVANFFRQFLPSIIGGDVIRGHDAWKAGASGSIAIMSLVLDRFLGLLALALLAMTAVLFDDRLNEDLPGLSIWLIAAFVGLSVTLSLLLFGPQKTRSTVLDGQFLGQKLGNKLTSILQAVMMYNNNPFALWRGLALSVVLQINVVTFYWSLSQALGLDVSYGHWFVIAPIAIFVMMIPLSINGIGVREAIFIFLLSQWGTDDSTALALAWLEYGIFLAFGLIGGAVYMMRKT